MDGEGAVQDNNVVEQRGKRAEVRVAADKEVAGKRAVVVQKPEILVRCDDARGGGLVYGDVGQGLCVVTVVVHVSRGMKGTRELVV